MKPHQAPLTIESPRRRPVALGLVLALTALVGAPGCAGTKFRQTHYVGVVHPETGTFQVYRFRIKGHPGLLNRTQFVSGWYSDTALAAISGEHVPSDEENFGATSGAETKVQYWVTGPEGATKELKDMRLALIMATDPTPITDAIKSVANSEELGKLVDAIRDREVAKAQKQEKRRSAAFSQICNIASGSLEGNPVAKGLFDELCKSVAQEDTSPSSDLPAQGEENSGKNDEEG